MTWTTDRPSQPGLYKFIPRGSQVIVFHKVEEGLGGGELFVAMSGSLHYRPVSDFEGQWTGPLDQVP